MKDKLKKKITKGVGRCTWAEGDALMVLYHDTEWGVPLHTDRKLFEFLLLDTFQAGLSWRTILHKRSNFKKAFDNFNAKKIAMYNAKKVRALLDDVGIVRNRLKVSAAIENARLFLLLQKEYGSFDVYIWQFVGGRPLQHKRRHMKDIPAHTKESDAMSKDLKKRGFRFVGSIICYAFMQAAGMVNDHLVDCFRHKEVQK